MAAADFSRQILFQPRFILRFRRYVLPTTRADYGLSPVRLRPCWAQEKSKSLRETGSPNIFVALYKKCPGGSWA